MFNILVDTCVWLDLAKDLDQRPILAVLRELIDLGEARLILPQIVLDEFARNKDRIVSDSGRSMASHFKRVKDAIVKFGDPKTLNVAMLHLHEVDHKIPMLGTAINASIHEIEALFSSVDVTPLNDSVMARAAQRALQKVAPFHRSGNRIADAVLIEMFADACKNPAAKGQRFAFVTHNVKDFSDPTGNDKSPHPDLACLFSRIKARYFIKLSEAVHSVRPDLVPHLMLEHEEWNHEPRPLSEILDAIDEMITKIWYDRHCVLAQKIAERKHEVVDRKTWKERKDNQNTTIDSVWKGAQASARRVEKKYGKKNLGPWSKFEWGMLNGKVSALRWILGEEWDELYT